jgi:hypothetical protein
MEKIFKIPEEKDYKAVFGKVDIMESIHVECGACSSCSGRCGGVSKCK